jgi:hypothetical protein
VLEGAEKAAANRKRIHAAVSKLARAEKRVVMLAVRGVPRRRHRRRKSLQTSACYMYTHLILSPLTCGVPLLIARGMWPQHPANATHVSVCCASKARVSSRYPWAIKQATRLMRRGSPDLPAICIGALPSKWPAPRRSTTTSAVQRLTPQAQLLLDSAQAPTNPSGAPSPAEEQRESKFLHLLSPPDSKRRGR